MKLFALLFFGLFTGFVNGFFGGGGGMLMVPVLTFLNKLPVKKAHATAILAILPLCIVSAICYLKADAFRWDLTIWVGLGVLAGGIAGALLLKKLSGKIITLVFSAVMLAAGIYMLI